MFGSEAIKRRVRPLLRPHIHDWQRFYDNIRGRWRTFSFREFWLDMRERRRALSKAVKIVPDVNGFRFVVYPFDRPNLNTLVRHPYDVGEFRAIPKLIKDGDTCVDVGANIGLYSVLLSRLSGCAGHVWAFEPVPETYWRLRETLVLNRCENVTPVQGAVSEINGVTRMNLFAPRFSEWNTFGSPAMPGPDGRYVHPTESVEVPTQSLDWFCEAENIERISFLKVDVEGFELFVFRGAERMLRERRIDCVCFEISQEPLKGAGVSSRQVFEALEAHGYTVYHFEIGSGRFEGPVRDTSERWRNFFASWKDLSTL